MGSNLELTSVIRKPCHLLLHWVCENRIEALPCVSYVQTLPPAADHLPLGLCQVVLPGLSHSFSDNIKPKFCPFEILPQECPNPLISLKHLSGHPSSHL